MPRRRYQKRAVIGDTQGETGAVEIKETRIEAEGPAGSRPSPESDDEAVRAREITAEDPDDPNDPED